MAERVCPHGHVIPESEKYCPQCGLPPTTPDVPPRQYPRTSMFGVPPEPRDDDEIRHWWRMRRIHYNVLLILAGFASVFTYFFIVSISPQLPMEETDWPGLFICMGGFFLIIGANIFYTLGWIGEIIMRRISIRAAHRFGPVAFGFGILFSIGIAFTPAISIALAASEARDTAPVTMPEVVGEYRFDSGVGTGILTIAPDGTYQEIFTVNGTQTEGKESRDGKTYNNSGRWKYDRGPSQGHRPTLTLADSFNYFWFIGVRQQDEEPWTSNHDYLLIRVDGRIILDGGDPDGWIGFKEVVDQ